MIFNSVCDNSSGRGYFNNGLDHIYSDQFGVNEENFHIDSSGIEVCEAFKHDKTASGEQP